MPGIITTLHEQNCNSDKPPQLLNTGQIKTYLNQVPGWEYLAEQKSILRNFSFANFYETVAFVNAAAWIAQQENHHPDISFGYNKCKILYTTHSAQGITLFDFICAAKINQLLKDE